MDRQSVGARSNSARPFTRRTHVCLGLDVEGDGERLKQLAPEAEACLAECCTAQYPLGIVQARTVFSGAAASRVKMPGREHTSMRPCASLRRKATGGPLPMCATRSGMCCIAKATRKPRRGCARASSATGIAATAKNCLLRWPTWAGGSRRKNRFAQSLQIACDMDSPVGIESIVEAMRDGLIRVDPAFKIRAGVAEISGGTSAFGKAVETDHQFTNKFDMCSSSNRSLGNVSKRRS